MVETWKRKTQVSNRRFNMSILSFREVVVKNFFLNENFPELYAAFVTRAQEEYPGGLNGFMRADHLGQEHPDRDLAGALYTARFALEDAFRSKFLMTLRCGYQPPEHADRCDDIDPGAFWYIPHTHAFRPIKRLKRLRGKNTWMSPWFVASFVQHIQDAAPDEDAPI